MTQTVLNVPVTERCIDMAEQDWRTPYAAGALDWGGNLKASLRKNETSKFGYEVTFEVSFKKSSGVAVGMLDEFFEELGFDPKANVQEEDTSDQYQVRLTRRDDVREFIEAVAPFLVARHEQAQILLEGVFPALEEGRHRKAGGMVEVAGMLDQFHEEGFQRGGSHKKYDAETVADDIGVEL